jgi:hypothetical protein
MLKLLSNHRDMRDMYIYIYIKIERDNIATLKKTTNS